MADAILDHADRAEERHRDLIHQLGQIRQAQDARLLPMVERTLTRITATTAGTVALCGLLAVLILAASAVWLGAPEVLGILAGRVQIAPAAPISPPEDAP